MKALRLTSPRQHQPDKSSIGALIIRIGFGGIETPPPQKKKKEIIKIKKLFLLLRPLHYTHTTLLRGPLAEEKR